MLNKLKTSIKEDQILKIAMIIFYVFLSVIPISNSYQDIVYALLFPFWLIIIFNKNNFKKTFNHEFAFPVILIFISIFISSILSINYMRNIEYLFIFFMKIIFFFMVITLLKKETLSKVILILGISASLHSLYIIIEFLTGFHFPNSIVRADPQFTRAFSRVSGLTSNPQQSGAILGLIIPLVYTRFLEFKNKTEILTYGFFTLMIITGISFTMTRSVIIGTGFSILFITLILRKRLFILMITIGVILGIAGIIFLYRINPQFLNFGTLQARRKIWLYAFELFWKNPIFGNGPRSVIIFHSGIEHRTAHSLFIDTLSTLGLFGFLSLSWFYIKIIKGMNNVFKRYLISKEKYLFVSLLGFFVEYIIDGIFDWRIFQSMTGYTVWMLFGFIVLYIKKPLKYETKI